MSTTSNLKLTLLDEKTLIDNGILNTNYTLIDNAFANIGGSKAVKSERISFGSPTALMTGTIFDPNDYDIMVFDLTAFGPAGVSVDTYCGYLWYGPGTNTNASLLSIRGQRWYNSSSGAYVDNAINFSSGIYLNMGNGQWNEIFGLWGSTPNNYFSSVMSQGFSFASSDSVSLTWPIGTTTFSVKPQMSSGNLSSTYLYITAYKL